MRAGLLGSWSSWLLPAALLGACSNIIGISSYEIDPSLDPESEGGSPSGGKNSVPEAGQAGQGATDPLGGGGAAGQGGDAPGPAGATHGGAGGEPGCESPSDCDDGIACTVDACGSDGSCSHTPDDTACDADPGECLTCVTGVGCLAAPSSTVELLLDANLDERTGDWNEIMFDNAQPSIVAIDGMAHTPSYSAMLLPTASTTVQAYIDLLQYVTIPLGTVQLRLSGYTKQLRGSFDPAEDYAIAGLYVAGGSTQLLEFTAWYGDEPAIPAWTAFEFVAANNALSRVVGEEVTFDIFGYTFDSTFYFDTLSLQATVCE